MTTAKIMIVEDEALVAADLKNQLENMNYMVTAIASSCDKAMEKIEAQMPDLVLMDIQLRGSKDGIETAGEIKQKYKIPIIYLTAYSDDSFLKRAKITEPFGYLLKPVDTRELYSTIEMALYKAKMEKERDALTKSLGEALAEIKTLRGLVPICSQCKKIRNDEGFWNILETYIEKHSDVRFSHSLCPDCTDKLYGDEEWYIKMKTKKSNQSINKS